MTISEYEWIVHEDVLLAITVEIHQPDVFLVIGHVDHDVLMPLEQAMVWSEGSGSAREVAEDAEGFKFGLD